MPQELKRNKALSLLKCLGDIRFSIKVQGNSMSPLIKDGDFIMAQSISSDRLRLGDIIVFQTEQNRIIHRIVGIKKHPSGCLLCQKGDSSLEYGWIAAAQVIGKILLIKKNGQILRVDRPSAVSHQKFIAHLWRLYVHFTEFLNAVDRNLYAWKKYTLLVKLQRKAAGLVNRTIVLFLKLGLSL